VIIVQVFHSCHKIEKVVFQTLIQPTPNQRTMCICEEVKEIWKYVLC
jgi:hypothetical protein